VSETGADGLAAAGAPVEHARAVAIMLHGRGSSAQDILGLSDEIGIGEIAYLAPQAPGHTWYPQSFLAPLEANEPFLSRSLSRIEGMLHQLTQQG
jgi:hypothetical protein